MEAFSGKQFVIALYITLKRHFPELHQLLNKVPDHRRRHTYEVAEILAAGLLMFVLKRGSRNNTDQLSGGLFEQNYLIIFGLRLPIMDTVHDFLEVLEVEHLEKIRELLLRTLMAKKVFEKWKFNGFYNISFDGTGVQTFDYEPYEDCPYKETKNSIKWYVNVLEAKLVFANGWSFSLGTEWLMNQNGRFDKQDCEQAAFKRLAAKVKNTFPRLKVLVSADGLYCCGPVFEQIKSYNWEFIFTFKDDSLKSVWKQIVPESLDRKERVVVRDTSGQWITEHIAVNNSPLLYKDHQLNFVEYKMCHGEEAKDKHVHLTSLPLALDSGFMVSKQGRLRWKIENEGFNTQKNHGYALGNKYTRKSFKAAQNYYLLMQIAHMINQLVEKQLGVMLQMEEANRTLKAVVEDIASVFRHVQMSVMEFQRRYLAQKQVRY